MRRVAKRIVLYFLLRIKPNLYRSIDYSLTKLIYLKLKVLILYILARILQGDMRSKLRGTRAVFNHGVDQIGIIIANGPSALELDLMSLKSARNQNSIKIFMVNFALLAESFRDCGCDYLVLSDPETRPTANNFRNRILWDIITTNREMRIITPTGWHNDTGLIECKLGTCLHFNDNSLETITSNISPRKPRGYASLTAYKALAFACYMNFSQIYICGIDNSFFRGIIVNENNHLIQKSNHLSPDYSQDSDLSSFFPNGMADYFFDTSVMFSSLKKSFGHKNIFNLGKNSEVDIFPKNCSDPLFESLRKI